MGYDKRSLIIRQLQSNRSILNPKRINKLIYKAFYFFNTPTGDLKPIVDKLMPLTFFLTFRMVFVSCRLETLTLSLFGSVLGNQWQPLMLEEPISIFSFLNNLRAMSSSSERSNYSQRPLHSRYSRLEYFSNVVPTKQFVFWVLSWIVAKLRLHFFIIFSIFIF